MPLGEWQHISKFEREADVTQVQSFNLRWSAWLSNSACWLCIPLSTHRLH